MGGFYDTRRRHSVCGGLSPIDYAHLLEAAVSVARFWPGDFEKM
jgi:hypothetical protein